MSREADDCKDPLAGRGDEVEPLWGRGLRFVLVGELMNRQEMTVAQMAAYLVEQGHVLEGRASKVISDALRWEVRNGRVGRLGRGRYRYRSAPSTTRSRIRTFAVRCSSWQAARRRGGVLPLTPLDPRSLVAAERLAPQPAPPWRRMGWLWST